MNKGKARRVCLDARLVRGVAGGVEQAIAGLAHGLSGLGDGDEEYLFLTYRDAVDWLRPYLSGPCRILPTSAAPKQRLWPGLFKTAHSLLRTAYHQFSPLLRKRTIKIAHSNGVAEKSGAALVHFTNQNGFLTNLPTIYQPWDLQHLHLPQFFTPRERLAREYSYRLFCQKAALVIVASIWVKQDLIRHYGLAENKVKVIAQVPVLTALPRPTKAELEMVRENYTLPDSFIFYPAQTWPHKNHIALLHALALLRDQQQLTVPLVCSGKLYEPFFSRIKQLIVDLNLAGQVHFLGYVSEMELQCLYKMCRFLIFPSRFEGLGLPLLEAFQTAVPVACANVTALPEQAGNAALLFDPEEPEAIAVAIQRLWTDEEARARLSQLGLQRVQNYSLDQSARTFRAYYRWLADWPLRPEDKALLGNMPLKGAKGNIDASS
jgi:glycosyltransferase involved in cell wall biosynthesis